MQTDLAMAAAIRVDESPDGVIALPCPFLLGWVRNLSDEVRKQSRIAFLPEQNAICGKAVAPSSSRLLVILLDRLGQRQVNYGAHRGFVDSQSEGDRPDQHAYFVGHPAFLITPAEVRVHFPVICNRGNSLLL